MPASGDAPGEVISIKGSPSGMPASGASSSSQGPVPLPLPLSSQKPSQKSEIAKPCMTMPKKSHCDPGFHLTHARYLPQRRHALNNALKRNLFYLRRRLNLLSDQTWVSWLQSYHFNPVWRQLWGQWLRFYPTEPLDHLRPLVFRYCIKDFQRYLSKGLIIPARFHGIHHLARFLSYAILRNYGSRALCNLRRVPEPLYLMWAVMMVVRLAHTPVNINKPRGGIALMSRPYEVLKRLPVELS